MTSVRDRLRERVVAAQVAVSEPVLARLGRYLELLARWNRRVNLTALAVDPPTDLALERLIVEPLRAATLLPDPPVSWVDIGSGGGSPAVPIKLMWPRARLTMIESRGKKAAFLREAIRALGLRQAQVFEGRLEDAAEALMRLPAADVVTSRGVRVDAHFLDAAARLMVTGGRLLLPGSALETVPLAGRFAVERTRPFLVLVKR